jgi:hypothetical protein
VVDDDSADTTGPFLRALSLHYPGLKVVVPSGNIWQEYLTARRVVEGAFCSVDDTDLGPVYCSRSWNCSSRL